jgi:outer membrane cobalamin receptor
LTPPAPLEVTVQGRSRAERLQRSAEAVQVLKTERAQREGADLGEVLRRGAGVSVRRLGGLGSSSSVTLAGMTDNQLRFFLDGVPLELMGFGFGIGVVPVQWVERAEMYRGVVPIRFGSDALGGAINLVSEGSEGGARAMASYQVGSFGLYRGTALVRGRVGNTPLIATLSGFADVAANDYSIDVEIPNAIGRPEPARVRRLHDAYRAMGGAVEVAAVGLPWAERLSLRAYATDFHKQIQHNAVMTVPYGEPDVGENVVGATLRYEQALGAMPELDVSLLAGAARRRIQFVDTSRFNYDWRGHRVRERLEPGEIGEAEDTTILEDRGFARVGLAHGAASASELRLVSTLNVSSRAGANRLHDSALYLDPTGARRQLLTLVTGAEHVWHVGGDRLENIAFVKDYVYSVSGERGDAFDRATLEQGFTELSTHSHRLGAGNAVRLALTDVAFAKASYEYATRFPDADEVFGDGSLGLANLELEPEVSHNVNLSLQMLDVAWAEQRWRGALGLFYRDADRLIFEVPVQNDFTRSFNVWSSRAQGAEAAVGWTSPGDLLWLDANLTWSDVRNTSTRGPFADFNGDRIPNRPWLHANASARVQLTDVGAPRDELSLTWYGSYVGSFFRSWESAGRSDYKIEIDAQWVQSAAFTYVVRSAIETSLTFDVQNLLNARAYDFSGVQRPGRAFSLKGTLQY